MIKLMKKLAVVLTLFLSLNTNSFAENQKVKVAEGKVVQIYDGDTLGVSTSQGETKVLRLAYIDCPELNQNFGDRAKRNLEKLLLDKKIKFKIVTTDSFNRPHAVITLNNIIINQKQVHDGFAWATSRTTSNSYLSLEAQARKYKKGIWNTQNPISPWMFRKMFFDGNM